MSAISKQTVIVAGINVNVYSYVSLSEKGRPLAVLFLLHGRHGSTTAVEGIANQILESAQSQGPADRDLVVVTFV